MSFGGGGTPSADLPDIVDRSLSLLLLGSHENDTWASLVGTEVATGGPSALRWVRDVGRTAVGGNPYVDTDAFDPDSELAIIQQDSDYLINTIRGLNSDGEVSESLRQSFFGAGRDIRRIDIEDVLSQALSSARTDSTVMVRDVLALLNSADWDLITERAVDSFRNRQEKVHQERLRTLGIRYSGINGVRSSSFMISTAILTAELEDRVQEFDSNLSVSLNTQTLQSYFQIILSVTQAYISSMLQTESEHERSRLRYSLGSADLMRSARSNELDLLRAGTALRSDLSRIKLIAQGEEFDKNIEYNSRETLWDMDIMQRAGNIVSASTGAAVSIPGTPSKIESGLSYGLTGAALGAKVGGPVGAGIGGAIGLGAGILSGLID